MKGDNMKKISGVEFNDNELATICDALYKYGVYMDSQAENAVYVGMAKALTEEANNARQLQIQLDDIREKTNADSQ